MGTNTLLVIGPMMENAVTSVAVPEVEVRRSEQRCGLRKTKDLARPQKCALLVLDPHSLSVGGECRR